MKENKYDDPAFFDQYSQFQRSVQGLSAAGEWPALKKMLPDFTGKRVLDIGCGYGWHCRYAVVHGAAYVLGTDISERMLAVAREKTDSESIDYQRIAMEDMAFAPASFDIVISSLAFHYTPDFASICQKIYDFLSPGGAFVFSMEHPIFTAQGTQDWAYGADGSIAYWPVDHYFTEGKRTATFLGEQVVKYHRTLETILRGVLQAGFTLRSLVEPTPSETMLAQDEAMQNELRRPMMILIAAEK